ncbi:MAG: hypothetical protein WDN69_12215 [Aliidongia sp.]
MGRAFPAHAHIHASMPNPAGGAPSVESKGKGKGGTRIGRGGNAWGQGLSFSVSARGIVLTFQRTLCPATPQTQMLPRAGAARMLLDNGGSPEPFWDQSATPCSADRSIRSVS